jgi:hypothetical protein
MFRRRRSGWQHAIPFGVGKNNQRGVAQFSRLVYLDSPNYVSLLCSSYFPYCLRFGCLGDYIFRSQVFSGKLPEGTVDHPAGNRFANTWLAMIRMPLPKNYIQGIDAQIGGGGAWRNCFLPWLFHAMAQ